MIKVLYWNTHKNSDLVRLALWDRTAYDVIAVQEFTGLMNTAPPSPGLAPYHLIFHSGRAAVYIHKRHPINEWTPTSGPDWAAITLHRYNLTITSLYNDQSDLRLPIQLLRDSVPDAKLLLVGDFNLHHPLWDLHGRESRLSSELVSEAHRRRLTLLTPFGEVTRYSHNHRTSTIDLAWASQGINATCTSIDSLTGSDHIAQCVRIETDSSPLSPAPRYQWQKIDPDLALAEATCRFQNLPPTLQSPTEIDQFADWVIEQLNHIADVAAPKRHSVASGPKNAWWTRDTGEAVSATRRARRAYRNLPNLRLWTHLKEAEAHQNRTVREARRIAWRNLVHEASSQDHLLWRLERWARLRSGQPYELPHLPQLRRTEGEAVTACTHSEKSALLAGKFFPQPAALSYSPPLPNATDTVPIRPIVTPDDVASALKAVRPWKAPGIDGLPSGLLKACGPPLFTALALLATASFASSYYPLRFRTATVVVLRKPGKTPEQRTTPGGWRPISLLSTVGKLLERILAIRIASAAEEHRLLPEGQMGNRAGRSTEAAAKILIEAVKAAWSRGGIVSLLQLDLAGAFDTVNHERLLHVLRHQGLPEWLILWVRSFLASRTARLQFDGATSDIFNVPAGVPQGSPLSPILFILYLSILYASLKSVPGIITIGFADDTNIISFGRAAVETTRRLQEAWGHCSSWASQAGMTFQPAKSELIHFSRAHAADTTPIRLGPTLVQPQQTGRFLGIWLHRKLSWQPHLKHLKARLTRQTLALSGIAASAWGCTIGRARQLYTSVIRSSIAYGASAYHTPTEPRGRPRGIARTLVVTQNSCLRIVAGAFKATPIRHLETEIHIPPLDLYLNKRAALAERRFEAGPVASQVRLATMAATAALSIPRSRRGPRPQRPQHYRRPDEEKQGWLARWAPHTDRVEDVLQREWHHRWISQPSHRHPVPAAEVPPYAKVSAALRKHRGCFKYESSCLTQLRTGKIGLNGFLFERNVPTVNTPYCRCGADVETVQHIFLECRENEVKRATLPLRIRTAQDLRTALDLPQARGLVRWFLSLGRVHLYDLAQHIHPGADDTDEARPRTD